MIETICKDQLTIGEGPVWIPHTKELYWTDSEGKSIRCYSEKTGSWKEISSTIQASSLVPHADGGLVYGSKTGFYYLDSEMNTRMIAEKCDGKQITDINDLIADPFGRVYGGQESFHDGQKYDPGYLYKIDLDGTATIIEEGLHISNGMGFSPDVTSFYLVDTILRNIYRYDFDVIKGSIKNKNLFARLQQDDGLPDGLTVDRDGFIWVARFLGNGLTRYDPDGRIERKIDLGCAQPTSLTFGGIEFNDIYITSASAYWETELAPTNHDFSSHRGGELYRIKQEIVGKPEYLSRV